MASTFRYKTVDGSASAEVLLDLQIPSEQQRRTVWLYFNHSAFAAGHEAWVRFFHEGDEVLKLPAQIAVASGQNIWMACNGVFWSDVQRTYNPMSIVWNNSDAYGYHSIQPFNLVLQADKVQLTQTGGAGTIRALLAVLSQS